MKISCIVHTRDAGQLLEATLASVRWVDELLVVDMGSRDGTREVASRFADRVLDVPDAPRVDGVRNAFVAEATHEWVLVVDADEHLAADAEHQLRRLVAERGDRFDAFALPRYNTVAGQIMRGSLFYPDHQIRLFRKGTVRWHDSHHRPPEVVTGPGRLLELTPPDCPHLHHRNYEDLRHFIRKQLDYALSDRYDADPSSFDLHAAVATAHERLALRRDVEADGDLSHALAVVLAWDAVIRGLVHWDSLSPRPPLPPLAGLPELPPVMLPRWQVRLRRWLGRRHSLRFLLHRLRDRVRGLVGR